jgi:effector-binding domain-containing protein
MGKARVAAFVALVALICFATCAIAETTSDMAASVRVKKTEPRTVAMMRHKGPFSDLSTVMAKLMAEVQKGGYLTAGPVMCLFHNSPENTAQKDLDWQVMVPVINPGPMGRPPYDQMGFQFSDASNVAYVYHVGPYDKINDSYQVLFDWAKRNGYTIRGYPVETYWSDPSTTPKEKLVTEVQVPVDERKVAPTAK